MDSPRAIATALRKTRLHRGLTTSQLASEAGVSPSTVASYESGKTWPSTRTLWKLLDALGLDILQFATVLRSQGRAANFPQPASVRDVLPPAELPQAVADSLADVLVGAADLLRLCGTSIRDKGRAPSLPDRTHEEVKAPKNGARR